MLLRAFAVAVLVSTAGACAANRAGSACNTEPDVTPGFPTFAECAVTRTARPSGGTTPFVQYTPTIPRDCLKAVIDMVVDSQGVPVLGTARIVRTNDPGFASAAISALSQARYAPALKDGRPVAQWVRLQPTMVTMRSRGAPPSSADVRRASRAC